ncbi:transposase [Candidatus Uabimicrobium sp. HlEnr_7]|uniref:transposase n=1 Tax=Candidatus Uabimicrobium helgolandensis TaxID=3095367 RepID=UPI003558DBDF
MLPNRKNIRLNSYDYCKARKYFVTICCEGGTSYFGKIEHSQMFVNKLGEMIESQLIILPKYFTNVCIDCYQIMPNHIHGIIEIKSKRTGINLSKIIGQYKSITTNLYIDGVHKYNWPRFRKRFWQRGFYERIIRNDRELKNTRIYIKQNPINNQSL